MSDKNRIEDKLTNEVSEQEKTEMVSIVNTIIQLIKDKHT